MSPRSSRSRFQLTRRRFAFWIGFGAFALGERLNASCFDQLAAFGMRLAPAHREELQDEAPEHWRSAENSSWRWFERETFENGEWKITGRTTPINKTTGERYTGSSGYLSEDLVPENVRLGMLPQAEVIDSDDAQEANEEAGQVNAARRARHGRPPSKWLRSLEADEIRTWLKTIEVPETGVSGMTFWTHLTRDHFFDPEKIKGLTEAEQAKLHSAAHYGY